MTADASARAQAETSPSTGGAGDFTGAKTKGKRSKLSQRKPNSAATSGDATLKGSSRGGLTINTHPSGLSQPTPVNNGGGMVGGYDTMGMHGMGGLGSDPALLQQGSPTLLSALKGSSLRGTYGQDYSQAFKEDDMSALLDFKNPSSRLSLNTLAVDNSDLGGEDELTEALWSSFPGGVDSLLQSRSTPYDRSYDMGGPSGQAGPSGNGVGDGGDMSGMYFFANNGQGGGGASYNSSSYIDAYGGGGGGRNNVHGQMHMMRGGNSGVGQGHGGMHHMQMPPMHPNGVMGFSNPQQNQLPNQMQYYDQSGQDAYVQMPYQQQMQGQSQMQGGMMVQPNYQFAQPQMVHVPSNGALQPQQGGDGNGKTPAKGKRASKSQKGGEKAKKKAKKGSEQQKQKADLMQQNMMHNQMVPNAQYGAPQQMQPMGNNQPGMYPLNSAQMNGGGMMILPPGSRMYSGTSSMSTNTNGNGTALGGGGNGLAPQYFMNQMNNGAPPGLLSAEEGGLDQLEGIVSKLDKSTMNNIKESLYRMARTARTRGGRGGDAASHGQHPPVDKAQSLVDRCVANLLYHRYTDSPMVQGNDSRKENNANGNGMGMQEAGMGSRKMSGGSMNVVIQGRHGSA